MFVVVRSSYSDSVCVSVARGDRDKLQNSRINATIIFHFTEKSFLGFIYQGA
jgi:hypothetical protein